ncbi:Hypothetical protein FKW44_016790 [Caligus rogercresseyi]|uniref:Uncharacterized protein n=1 Tax=Caligus rogercresseyi TaxID=217165 RepID=A0A7T8H287_CALRO|nr:Hypothetical protein FKW44_016790 [Caligus rogercresseyi]
MQVYRLVDLHALLNKIIGLLPSKRHSRPDHDEGGFCLLKRVLNCTDVFLFF